MICRFWGTGMAKRLTSHAAVSFTARAGQPTLAVGNSDGSLHCLDGETGTLLWEKEVGKIEWGSVLWADLDGDENDELVASTADRGLAAFHADGSVLWRGFGENRGAGSSHSSQYRALSGIAHRTPPRGSSTSPLYRGTKWT